MNTIGIIAEYNPLHMGHAYQLSYLAERWPQALRIVVMSGSFVQRGMPAFFSKYDRAYWALLAGADMVIELPSLFALGSAEIFSAGAMRLLAALGVDAFCFGSEVTNLDMLTSIAEAANNASVNERIRELLKSGHFYGAALRQALLEIVPHADEALNHPNATLGIEYLRAIDTYGLSLLPIVIERQSDYNSISLTESLPSASALRNYLQANPSTASLACYFPEDVLPSVENALSLGRYVNMQRYYDMVHWQSRILSTAELSQLTDFGEGLENAWKKGASLPSWFLARHQLKSKRYSFSRLDRMAAYTVLRRSAALQKKAHQHGPLYARLLGFTGAARDWLRGNDSTLPLIQKWAPFVRHSTGLVKDYVLADMLATDIQHACFTGETMRLGDTDYRFTPHYLA